MNAKSGYGDILNCTMDCGFEHVKDGNGNKEFLILNTNDFFVAAKALEKIKKPLV